MKRQTSSVQTVLIVAFVSLLSLSIGRHTGLVAHLRQQWHGRAAVRAVAPVSEPGSDDDDAFAQVLKQSQRQGKPRLLKQQQGGRLAPIKRPAQRTGASTKLPSAKLVTTLVDSHRDTRACRPGRDRNCKCVKHCHECLVDPVNNTLVVGCIMCRNAKFLYEEKCLDECPTGTKEVGAGSFEKYCYDPAAAKQPQAPPLASRSKPKQNHVLNVRLCACAEDEHCVKNACDCATHACTLCSSFKYLEGGRCVETCSVDLRSHGTARIGRRCLPRFEHPAHRAPDGLAVDEVDIQEGTVDLTWGLETNRDRPNRVVVRTGTRVVWTIEGAHGITSGLPGRPDGKFSSGPPGLVSRYEHVFTKPGKYPYHCRSHSGALQGLVVVVNQRKLKASEMGVKYVLLHEGFRKAVPHPQRFDTAMRPSYWVLDKRVNNVEACQAWCTMTAACRGIYYYRSTGRCKGLKSFGPVGIATKVNADSYAKMAA
eukprot:m.222335 g.222335  ORF g.222335 m.222335 type:complete len:481 (+) comp17253_c0_seq2:76-1518(+)